MIADLAKAKCGGPINSDYVRDYYQANAIDMIARRRYWWHGYLFTFAVFIGLAVIIHFMGLPAPIGVFMVIIFFTWLARLCFFAVMAGKLRNRCTIEELAEIWQYIGGFHGIAK